MLKKPFREHHLLALLHGYEAQKLPLDLFMNFYFRDHKALGSKDRGEIAELIYAMVRVQSLLDYICQQSMPQKSISWEKRYQTFKEINLEALQLDLTIPLHIRLSFPAFLVDLLIKHYGEQKAIELCQVSNTPAPLTIRVNTLKTTREALIKLWQDEYSIKPCEKAQEGIIFLKRANLFNLPEFKEGFFEVQDEGSQLLASLVKAEPGQLFMDYCAGSGGKTLAVAPHMQNKGQIFLHDIRSYALDESKKRLHRAGIQNAQRIGADDPKLKKLKKKMDWVLVDAPCSGTGTIRRNPDMKHKFQEETLKRLVGQQRTIFEKALSYLKPDGYIVFGTCSILKEENEEQVAHFLKTYKMKIIGEPLQTLPTLGGMDGFFGVVLAFQ
jgi:16S rRNA (cytosine967-C5)-methyltransferase